MFKAVLQNVELERPVQCFGPTEATLAGWIVEALKKWPVARVEVREIREVVVAAYVAVDGKVKEI